ncbi:MAG: RNA-guided endonuclease InsQ/TnpB family protein [Clostridium butyricum]
MSKSKKAIYNCRTIKIDINKTHPMYNKLRKYGHLNKNLYNYALYEIRQLYILSKKTNDGIKLSRKEKYYLKSVYKWIANYNIKVFKGEVEGKKYLKLKKILGGYYMNREILSKRLLDKKDYKALPVGIAKKTIWNLDGVWKAYFSSMFQYIKTPQLYTNKPNLPNYKTPNRKDSKAQYLFIMDNSQIKINNGILTFTAKRDKDLKNYSFTIPKLKQWSITGKRDCNLMEVRFIPKGIKYTMEIVYGIPKKQIVSNHKRIIGIDIGVDRLATVSNNIGQKPFAINGKPLKSINNYWNKQVANYKSNLMKVNGKHSSKQYLNMCNKRNNRINTYIHQSAAYIIKWCVENQIDTIVIGKNKFWKQNCNIGKSTQTFVQLPFDRFIQNIQYRAEDKGIEVILNEESYTSKSSFIDNDDIPNYDTEKKEKHNFSGKRTKRGLYVAKEGTKIHADLNGSYNIIRKKFQDFSYSENCYLHPYIVTPNCN